MAIEWTPEKVNACAALYGKLNWNVSVGDRCVKFDELGNDPQDIELVNSVGGDSTDFMRGKVWLLTSDDVEQILCSMGWDVHTNIVREKNVGGIAHRTECSVVKVNGLPSDLQMKVADSDPHFARLKILQRVVNNEQPANRQDSTQESEATSETDEQSVERDASV